MASATGWRKQIPDPIMGRPPSFEECLEPGADLAAEYAQGPDGEADRRCRPEVSRASSATRRSMPPWL